MKGILSAKKCRSDNIDMKPSRWKGKSKLVDKWLEILVCISMIQELFIFCMFISFCSIWY
ncbi:hypothetical protein V6Z11_A05G237100 [Gossypium hirsutum]